MEHFAQIIQHFTHLTGVIELLKVLFETGASFIAFMSALFVVWRKVKKSIDHYTTQVDCLAVKFGDIVKAQEKLSEHQEKLTNALTRFGVKIEARERDTIRLEGAMDATRKDMIQLVSAVQQASGSLDGLWRTLQTLFPSQVPKRASDKG